MRRRAAVAHDTQHAVTESCSIAEVSWGGDGGRRAMSAATTRARRAVLRQRVLPAALIALAAGVISLVPAPHAALAASQEGPAIPSATHVASTLSGVLRNSLGRALAGASVSVYPPGTGCRYVGAVTTTTTAADGSFSTSVSPGSYDVNILYESGPDAPFFEICTQNVNLATSRNETLTIPVTQLTVTAQAPDGDRLQGATIPGAGQASLAEFDLFPGQPIDGNSFLQDDHEGTTGAAGTATIALMPMTSPLTLSVEPPPNTDLAPTTISTGLMTTSTAVTATLAEPVTLSGVLRNSLGRALAGASVSVYPPGTGCRYVGAVTTTTTAADGSFSTSVSPGSYDVNILYESGPDAPFFEICTQNVNLATSRNETLTIPVTQLTVTAQAPDGDRLQGATIPGAGQASLAEFDLFPGQPIDGNSFLQDDHEGTTGAAGTATIALMPMTSPLTLSVEPPPNTDLAPTTISTGLMTTSTAVTATLAEPVTLSGVLRNSLGRALAGASVSVYPPGTGCRYVGAVTTTTTAADGSFSTSVSPGSYDVNILYESGPDAPFFEICTQNVNLATSRNETLTIPVTQLTVTAQAPDGDRLQGATIPGAGQASLAEFDLFPGQPIDGNSFLQDDHEGTTGAAGTATIALMPMTSPLTLSVEPPPNTDLAPTTISTGLMTTSTAVTATLAEKSGAPPPPTDVMAKPGNGSAIVSWTAPTLQTGSVTGYTATASPGSQSCTTTGATTCTITGLANGTTYTVTVIAHTTVGDSGPSAPVTVTPAGTGRPVFTSPAAVTAAYGARLTFTATATGSPAPRITHTGPLPPGVRFAEESGGRAAITGTPGRTAAGPYRLTLKATNSAGTATQAFTLTITRPPALAAPAAATATTGRAFRLAIKVTGYPAAALAESGPLPIGLAFTSKIITSTTQDVIIAGTPAAGTAGSYPLTITAISSSGMATAHLTLTIAPRSST